MLGFLGLLLIAVAEVLLPEFVNKDAFFDNGFLLLLLLGFVGLIELSCDLLPPTCFGNERRSTMDWWAQSCFYTYTDYFAIYDATH